MNRWPDEHLWKTLTDLFQAYLSIIVKDHHKTHDGMLTMYKHYNGWNNQTDEWVIEHDGYCNRFSVGDRNPNRCIQKAIQQVQRMIQEEKEWRKKEGIL